MMSDPFPIRLRNVPAQLDRRIRNAFPAVEHKRLENRLRRTCVDTACTGSAPVRRRRIDFQFEIRQDATQKKPGSDSFINDARVLSKPADTGVPGKDALVDGTRVDI